MRNGFTEGGRSVQPEESCYSILLVSASEKFNASFLSLLSEGQYSPIRMAGNAGEARRAAAEASFDLAVINTPLPDETGILLAEDLCGESSMGILLLVRAEHYPEVSVRASSFGILTLPKPTSAPLLRQSLMLLCGTRERLRRMERKTASMEEKMEEIRLVNRAKWLLIEQLKMTEQEAHRYIEKQAMDRCVTKKSVAESILRTYR